MIIEPIAFTPVSNGSQSIALNNISGVPDGVVFFTGGKYNVNETANARGGIGIAGNDGAGGVYYQTGTAHLKNSTGPFVRNYPGADASATLDGSSGNPVNLIDVTGFAAGEIDISVSGADANFQVFGFAYQG